VDEHTDFKYGVQGDHGKSQPMDDKAMWSCHMTHWKFLVPLKYFWNSLSKKLQILYTGWPCEVLAFRLTNSPSRWHGHCHLTSLNFGK